MFDYEKIKEYDKNKTKVLKYVLYKKRTESEIRRKFEKDIEYEMLDEIIEELKQNNYISDNQYIERAVNEFIALKNLSLKQIKYKLLSKCINNKLIEEYFYKNEEDATKFYSDMMVRKKENGGKYNEKFLDYQPLESEFDDEE